MTRSGSIARTARRDGGAVLVMFALMLPVLIGFGGLVIDVGNWFAHKRHLQTQADAGALAGAGEFRLPLSHCSDTAINEAVAKYSTVDDADGYNPQIGDTPLDELHEKINSPTWYGQSTPVDDTVRGPEGQPCAAKMIDVKLTETDLPWWLKLFGDFVPFINTHARVEILQQRVGAGSLPVGVPEVAPKKARAIFVDEVTGTEIASTPLVPGTSDGLSIWSNVDAPVPVTVNSARIGVRIVLSGSSSTACGDPLVNCYGAGTNTAIVAGRPGLVHIRGWSSETAGTATAPRVRHAELFAGQCEDGYFTTTTSYPCVVNVGAVVDFGGAAIDTVRVLAKKTGANNNTAVALTPPTATGGQWTGSSGASISAASGANSIELLWQTGCDTDRTKPCNTTRTSLGTVQRAFAGSETLDASGPIKMLRVSEDSLPGANSFERCATCTHNLVVTVGLKPSLENAQSVADVPVSLKVAGGGSQNQALDCDPDLANLRDELANGCGPTYAPNEGQACPVKNVLWGSPPDWNCVVIGTGGQVGQVTQGLNLRILGAEVNPPCTAPNDWASFPDFSGGDPRIIQVFLTPFGAFSGAGGTTVPVTGFATFYVTGWDGGGCQGSGDDPAGQGEIVGHFIKYVKTLNDGSAGDEVCDENAFGSCVAVITR